MTDSSSQSSQPSSRQSGARLSRLSGEVRDNLVAYLDGECDEETARSIDQLLSTNEVARKEVDRLSRVYDLLDHLPRPAASSDFSEETMQSVAAIAPVPREEPIDFRGRLAPWTPLVRLLAVSFACTLVGLFAGRYFFADKSESLLGDLDSIENVEAFRAVHSPEFVDWISRDSVRRRLKESLHGE